MPILMKKGDFAAYRKVGPSAVSNWAKKGLIVYATDPDRPGKQLVDVEKSDLLINGTIDPTRGRPSKADQQSASAQSTPAADGARQIPINGLETARLEEMRERTIGRKIENERTVGNLVPLADAERRASDTGRMTRERSHGVIRAQAEWLAAQTDPRVIVATLSSEFDKMFATLADEIEEEARAELVADATLSTLDEDAEDDVQDDAAAA